MAEEQTELDLQKARGDFLEDPSSENDEVVNEEEVVEEDEEESTPEGEEEVLEEEGEEEVEEEEPTAKTKSIKVPKSRLDKVIAQREVEKERVSWLEDQLEALIEKGVGTKDPVVEKKEVLPEFDFPKAEQEYADFLLGGDSDKAAALRSKITAEQAKAIMQEVQGLSEKTSETALKQTQEAIENTKLEAVVETLEAQYPFLDYNSDQYNEEATETINDFMTIYAAKGMTKAEALRKAVIKMAPMYSEEVEEVATQKQKRTAAAKTKRVKASNAQPPKTATGVKTSADGELSVSKLSRKEFKNLTQKEKAILRGDIIA